MADWKYVGYDGSLLPVSALEKLDAGLKKALALIEALSKIMKLLQMFISAFASLNAVLKTFISLVQGQLKQLSGGLGNAGVFINILIPPAFIKGMAENPNMAKLSTGGFEGFLERFKVSLYNTSDKNRPLFTKSGEVGGLILLADTETLADFYKAMNFITGLFSFSDIYPFNTEPPPPRNLRASSGYFYKRDGTSSFGIKLEWDSPLMGPFLYRVSRSEISGGILTTKTDLPSKLVGPDGLLNAMKIRMTTGEWPKEEVRDYAEKNIVAANIVTGNGEYIDFNLTEEDKQYFYIVECGVPPFWGAPAPQIAVFANPSNCINANTFGIVENDKGHLEVISIGLAGGGAKDLGQWSSVQVKAMLPFLPPILETMDSFLEALKGNLESNTKSFVNFLNGIIEKFKKYAAIVDAVVTMILALENFFSSAPKMAMLFVPVGTGGIDNFYEKVKNARPPTGGFSSKSGISLGVVMVWGASLNNPLDVVDAPAVNAQLTLVNKAFELFAKIFK